MEPVIVLEVRLFMPSSALAVLKAILSDPTNPEHVRSLCEPDLTYVSLNYEHPSLKRVMPWCGTSRGPDSIVQTFVDVGRYWRAEEFRNEAELETGERAAIFGRFTYTSVVLGKTVVSPFAVFARVREGLCFYMQFMEDTLATTESFRAGGAFVIRSNPDGSTIEI
jgi:uncharacterized protein